MTPTPGGPAAIASGSLSSTSAAPDDGAIPKRILAVAHRGASAEFPENTIPAFTRALDLGVDAIELDVRVTRDGVVVVHHDADVRLGPGGPRAPISRLSAAELRAVDFGGGIGVPTLDEVMELVAGRAEVFVELKRPVEEEAVLACVERHRGPYALHSFDHDAIARLASRAPHIRRGILFDDAFVDPMLELTVHLRRTQAHDVWPRHDLVTPALVSAAQLHGARVIAWTVNDAQAGRDAVIAGVDGICTDDARWLLAQRQAVAGSPAALPASTLAPPVMHT